MNGVVKWLFMFVFGFIAAFTFMFFVSGSVEQSNQGVINLAEKPYADGEKFTSYGVTFLVNGNTIGIQGKQEGRTYSLFKIKDLTSIPNPEKNIQVEMFLTGDYGINEFTYIRSYADLYNGNTYKTSKIIPATAKGFMIENLLTEEEVGLYDRIAIYIQTVDTAVSGYKFNAQVKLRMTQEVEIKGQNMLTWFTNIVNTTRQQSFWDFVKEPIQRFIDKMTYFDSLEQPSFVEVLTAIWNVFLLILSPIEIIGRALWWLALVLYDLIPLLLNPTWV